MGSIRNDCHPFGLQWLDSSYQESTLPHTPWSKVSDTVLTALATHVERQLTQPGRVAAIFHLTGEHFRNTYFPTLEVPALDSVCSNVKERSKLISEATHWLNNSLSRACTETGCLRPHPPPDSAPRLDDSKQAPHMQAFEEHTVQIVSSGLKRHIVLAEKKSLDKMKESAWADYHAARTTDHTQAGSATTRGILKIKGPKGGNTRPLSSDVNHPTRPDTKTLQLSSGPSGVIDASSILGESVIALLRRDPGRFSTIATALAGRILPSSLRAYIWLDCLLMKERHIRTDGSAERAVRERFGQAVSRGISELNTKRATHCPISSLIDTAVIEIYSNTPGLAAYLHENSHQKESARVLNVLYTYDRSYEPYLVYWLFPIQLAFRADLSEGAAHVYELALYVSLLSSCFPRWPSVHAIAESALQRLTVADPTLCQHLASIAQIDPQVNYKDFLVEAMHLEKKAALNIIAAQTKDDADSDDTPIRQPRLKRSDSPIEFLTDPVVFIRKWIGEGFVSVLDTACMLWVWDQCFLARWEPITLELICVALIELLRNRFMSAKNYTDMKSVFMSEPCKLYTQDVRRAWNHLRQGGHPVEIPPFNRSTAPMHPTGSESGTGDTSMTVPETGLRTPTTVPSFLPTFSLKNLNAMLVFTPEIMKLHPWLKEFSAARVNARIAVYFGSVCLAREATSQPPEPTSSPIVDAHGRVRHNFTFPESNFTFNHLDVSQLDVEKELQGKPWLVVQLGYTPDRSSGVLSTRSEAQAGDLALGWCKIRACFHRLELEASPESEIRQGDWVLAVSHGKHGLIPGRAPDNATVTGSEAVLRAPAFGSLLVSGSILSAAVCLPGAGKTPPPPSATRTPPPPSARRASLFQQPKSRKPSLAPQQRPVADSAAVVPPGPAEPGPAAVTSPDINTCFDLYVDQITNIPDNATIVKVTGRLLRTGPVTGVPDVLAVPILTSSARSPKFRYRQTVNVDAVAADAAMLAFLRVYTIDKNTQKMCVIGSCLAPCYDEKGKLLVGGQCLALYSGKPGGKHPVSSLIPSSLHTFPRVPACKLLIRLLVHGNDVVATPADSDYYKENVPLNDSEKKLVGTYEADSSYPETERDMAVYLHELLHSTPLSTDDDSQVTDWITNQLDQRAAGGIAAGDLDILQMVEYRKEQGLCCQLKAMYGLPQQGKYIQCLVRAMPLSPGVDEKFVTQSHDYDSYQAAPHWKDPAQRLKVPFPGSDTIQTLMIQVFGLKVTYKPTKSHSAAGRATMDGNKVLALTEDTVLGWAVLNVFQGQSVLAGEHHIPLYSGRPDAATLQALTAQAVESCLAGRSGVLPGAAVVIDVWDGHFDIEHLPSPLQRTTNLLSVAGSIEKYKTAEAKLLGPKISEFILASLEKKARKQGSESEVYVKEQGFFSQLMEQAFYSLMEGQLMEGGYGPL